MEKQKRKLELTDGWLKVTAGKVSAGAVDYTDTKQRGLVLRVEASGEASWVCRYRFAGRQRRFRLGAYPDMPLTRARKVARDARTMAEGAPGQQPIDPAAERDLIRLGQSVTALVEAWKEDKDTRNPLARWKGGLTGGTARSYLPHVRAFVGAFGTRTLATVTAAEAERFIADGNKAATRNRRLVALRLVFAWAKRKGIIATDPTHALTKERETPRQRTLTDAELAALLRGFDSTRLGRAVRFLAVTGLRRDEAIGAMWDWVEGDVLTIPPEAEKTGETRGEQRRVPLSDAAVAILAAQRAALFAEGVRSVFVFATETGERPHPDALKPKLNRLRGLRSNGQPATHDKRGKARPAALPEDVTIHDVRRTVADGLLNRCNAAPWVVDSVVLGHARPKMMRTYMPVLPLSEAREALNRWADTVAGIMGEPVVVRKDGRG